MLRNPLKKGGSTYETELVEKHDVLLLPYLFADRVDPDFPVVSDRRRAVPQRNQQGQPHLYRLRRGFPAECIK
ncbi:hypothetical protein D3C81_1634040 [compost metagenome]